MLVVRMHSYLHVTVGLSAGRNMPVAVHSHHQHARSSRHRAATRAPYAAFVKEILFAPEDGRMTRNMSSQINKYLH